MESVARGRLILAAFGLLFSLVTCVSAQCMIDWGRASASSWGSFADIQTSLVTIGAVVGLLFMVLEGIAWMMAEGPEEREDAKKGIIYILIGLIILTSAYTFVRYLLC